MEKYFAFIMLAAPGFIAKFTARLLGDTPSKRGEFESILIYFMYTFFSLTTSLAVMNMVGLFSLYEPWTVLEKNFLLPLFCVQFMLISVVCSILVGASWYLWFEGWLVAGFNKMNKNCGRNHIFLKGSLFDRLFNDGLDHFLIMQKEGKEVLSVYYVAGAHQSLNGWKSVLPHIQNIGHGLTMRVRQMQIIR